MIVPSSVDSPRSLSPRLSALYRAEERQTVQELLSGLALPAESLDRIHDSARQLVTDVRRSRVGKGGIDAFMHEYALSSEEGVVLMCLAEALLRIPDAETADRLIRDKIGPGDWERHLGHSGSVFVNASTWALMLTGRVVNLHGFEGQSVRNVLGRLVNRVGEPVIRQSVTQGMRILGRQFVMGRSIDEALARARDDVKRGYRHSYDMLGEAARTARDAERYLAAYESAIRAIGEVAGNAGVIAGPGISVKLSALHPRYEYAQRQRALDELAPRFVHLCAMAREAGIGLTMDAEEADRLELSLEVFERACADTTTADWDGLGLAVQAYQKRAAAVVEWTSEVARRHRRRLMVRLVKGAYWDTEIKRAQERGLDGYPVFSRKVYTDVSYLRCARMLLDDRDRLYPQFATHNAHTVAAIVELAGNRGEFEFQRLHGMGEALYEPVVDNEGMNLPCRIYAPVGSHEDLLAYLVRRLLENGANTSFVNRIVDESAPIDEIIADPIARARRLDGEPHPHIRLPGDLYRPERGNSAGIDLSDPAELAPLKAAMEDSARLQWRAQPLIGGVPANGADRPALNPANVHMEVGRVTEAGEAEVADAVARGHRSAPDWDAAGADHRAECLERTADLYERHHPELMALAVREAGKTLPDAVAEVREAVDFLRYYAARARAEFGTPRLLPGPTGESNHIALHGRGVFACISPWNFPLAIFTGQVAAALAAGNAVCAKPAEQTPLIAAHAVSLFHRAGVPPEVLQLLPGDGPRVGAPLVNDPRIAGVAFTGSTETARAIHRSLAARDGPIVPLIAETGGQNAMIVDSSALPEQVVADVVASAFQSAGQRCSALRVLFVQTDVAERVLEMLAGAMEELRIGDPALLSTDVGPVIDRAAERMLNEHAARMDREARLVYRCNTGDDCDNGYFFGPRAYEIDRMGQLEREVFGPILHIVRYRADRLDAVIDGINATGYGLTLGIHSRIDDTIEHIHRRARVGNCYVNRNQIGAVVGVQPFGGEGLSGTGPKAGGPHYLARFATERVLTINTTAQGGNASLMSLGDD